MQIELIGHTLRYEVESVIDVFFPGFRKNNFELYIKSEYTLSDIAGCRTTITYNDKTITEKITTEKLDFYSMKMLIKRSFYIASTKLLDFCPSWGTITGIRPSKIVVPMLNEHKSDEEISSILKNDYFLSDRNIVNTIKCAKYTVSAKARTNDNSISLYIAIPYCPSRCNYCSFVSSSIERELLQIPQYLENLYTELKQVAKIIRNKNLEICTIYIGGGTPTILTAEQLECLINNIHMLFDLNSVDEFTIEAGRPDTITKEKLLAIKKICTPRISINPQTLNDDVLKAIGRRHTAKQFLDSFELARSIGFNDINVDIIAGLTNDTIDSFKNTLDIIYKMKPENITVHSLAIKHSSNLAAENNPFKMLKSTSSLMIDYTKKILDKYEPYYMYKQRNTVDNLENIGYALKGKQCLYNIYMMNEMHTVIGIGASAVTKVVTKETGKIHRVANCKLPFEYIKNFDEILNGRISKLNEYNLI